MSNFYVGQEVVSVGVPLREGEKRDYRGLVNQPVRGAHYIVREVRHFPGFEPALLLMEIVNAPVDTMVGVIERGWHQKGFRPIKSETIEVFREMCRAVSKGVGA